MPAVTKARKFRFVSEKPYIQAQRILDKAGIPYQVQEDATLDEAYYIEVDPKHYSDAEKALSDAEPDIHFAVESRNPFQRAQAVLEGLIVQFTAATPVTASPRATRLLERIQKVYAVGEAIALDSGYGWDDFQRRIGNQVDLYMNEDQIRRDLWDLIETGFLKGDPRKGIALATAGSDDLADD